jgi:hypothetical protein
MSKKDFNLSLKKPQGAGALFSAEETKPDTIPNHPTGIKKKGRPPGDNPQPPGQTKPGDIRFTFIASEAIINDIKSIATYESKTIKEILNEALTAYISNYTPSKKQTPKLQSNVNR